MERPKATKQSPVVPISSLHQRGSLTFGLGEMVFHTGRGRKESAINANVSTDNIYKTSLVKARGEKNEQSGENTSTLMAPTHRQQNILLGF